MKIHIPSPTPFVGTVNMTALAAVSAALIPVGILFMLTVSIVDLAARRGVNQQKAPH